MSALAWLLLALGALVLVLTQIRLRSSKGRRGMTDIAPVAINVHTGLGLLSGVIVALRLLGFHESGAATWVAIIAMAIVALLGLAFLARWRGNGGGTPLLSRATVGRAARGSRRSPTSATPSAPAPSPGCCSPIGSELARSTDATG